MIAAYWISGTKYSLFVFVLSTVSGKVPKQDESFKIVLKPVLKVVEIEEKLFFSNTNGSFEICFIIFFDSFVNQTLSQLISI